MTTVLREGLPVKRQLNEDEDLGFGSVRENSSSKTIQVDLN